MKTKAKTLIIITIVLLAGFTGNVPAAGEKELIEAPPKGITIQLEFIEVSHSDLNDLLFEKEFGTDAGELRRQIQKKAKAGEASIVETVIIQVRDSMRASTMSVNEIKSPKNYDEIGAGNFEIQNTGVSVKADPVIADDGNSISLNLTSEFCERIADADYGSNSKGVRIIQPQFHKARIETSLMLDSGAYAFIGTVRLHKAYDTKRKDPIVMVFVRAMIHHNEDETTAGEQKKGE